MISSIASGNAFVRQLRDRRLLLVLGSQVGTTSPTGVRQFQTWKDRKDTEKTGKCNTSTLASRAATYVSKIKHALRGGGRWQINRKRLQPSLYLHSSEEMDLSSASSRRDAFDKVVMLLLHGETLGGSSDPGLQGDRHRAGNYDVWFDRDPESLTGRGLGQALNLSRKTASYCTQETKLLPELFVVAPLRKVLQTTCMAFPYDTPQQTIRDVRWMYHPDLVDASSQDAVLDVSSDSLLRTICPGVGLVSLPRRYRFGHQKNEAWGKANDFVEWLSFRPEKTIVISGGADTMNELHSLFTLSRSISPFRNGELRVYGLNFR